MDPDIYHPDPHPSVTCIVIQTFIKNILLRIILNICMYMHLAGEPCDKSHAFSNLRKREREREREAEGGPAQ